MTEKDRSLKSKNIPTITAAALLDALLIAALANPGMGLTEMTAAGLARWAASSMAPFVILVLISMLPSDTKAVLVYWRVRDVLPGHRAFSDHVQDPRIDTDRLKKNVGDFPVLPRDQNTLWYRLFKKVEDDPAVSAAHGTFLLFRDVASMSVLLVPLMPIALLWAGSPIVVAASVAGLFFLQYIATAIAARHQGVRLVTSVLALHSVKGNGKK